MQHVLFSLGHRDGLESSAVGRRGRRQPTSFSDIDLGTMSRVWHVSVAPVQLIEIGRRD